MKRLFEKAFKLPFKHHRIGSHVFDQNTDIAFEFLTDDKDIRQEIMASLNTTYKPSMFGAVTHNQGVISDSNSDLILIRGWGYLTGTGGLNLPDEEAAAIQDDLADYIVERLKSE